MSPVSVQDPVQIWAGDIKSSESMQITDERCGRLPPRLLNGSRRGTQDRQFGCA
jgi:hypothetical protein